MIRITVRVYAAFYEVLTDKIIEKEYKDNGRPVPSRDNVWAVFGDKYYPFRTDRASHPEYFKQRYKMHNPRTTSLDKVIQLNHAAMVKACKYIGIKTPPDEDPEDFDNHSSAKYMLLIFEKVYHDRIQKINKRYSDNITPIVIKGNVAKVIRVTGETPNEALNLMADFFSRVEDNDYDGAWELLTENFKARWKNLIAFRETYKNLRFIKITFVTSFRDAKKPHLYICDVAVLYSRNVRKLTEQLNLKHSLAQVEEFYGMLKRIQKKFTDAGTTRFDLIPIHLLFGEGLYEHVLKFTDFDINAISPFNSRQDVMRHRMLVFECDSSSDTWLIDSIISIEDPLSY